MKQINKERLIIKKVNSVDEENDYLLDILHKLTLKENKKVAILNSKKGIQSFTDATLKYNKQHSELLYNAMKNNEDTSKIINDKSYGDMHISRVFNHNLKKLINKIRYIKFSKDRDIIIICNIDEILTDYEEQKNNINDELEKIADKLQITIIYVEKEI